MIDIERSGLILHVERYDACVEFYRDKIGLAVELQKNEPGQILTLMTFGGSYLMVEPGGVARDIAKTAGENPVMIRFNVRDVDAAASSLRQRGVEIAVSRFSWGVIASFCDPDGNRCELREAASFGR